MAPSSISSSTAGSTLQLLDPDHFGCFLRRAREERNLTLREVAEATKVPHASLERLESADLAGLPAEVFVRGFIRSYARAVGVPDTEPLSRFDRALKARDDAKRAQSAMPVVDPTMAGISTDDDLEGVTPRRGLGLAVFVIILLLIATITLSLLLRRPPQSGEGLSQGEPAASPPAARIAT